MTYRIRLRVDPEDGWQWYELRSPQHTITVVRFSDERRFTAWSGDVERKDENPLTAAALVAAALR